MTAVVVTILILVSIAVVAVIVGVVRGASTEATKRVTAPAPPLDRPRPILADFHVKRGEALVFYAVPAPRDDIGDHLRDLLFHDAVAVLHEKRSHDLPLDQVGRIRVFGERDGNPVEVGVLDLEEPGQLPELAAPDLVPHASVTGYDPLAQLGERDLGPAPGVTAPTASEGLPPFISEISLTGSLEASLRALGVDPESMSLDDLTLGLLRSGGYQVSAERTGAHAGDGSRAGVFLASKEGRRTFVVIVPHENGQHPEVAEHDIDAFTIGVARANPDAALLISDKFGPYMMYDKERRDPRCRFITRERLQAFVDSFALT